MPRRRYPFQPPDPAPDYTEWTQHRYDPGYWLGGRIPPHLKRQSGGAGRRNPYGILLLLSAITTLIYAGSLIDHESSLAIVQAVLMAGVVLLQGVAGFKLLRGRRRKPTAK